MTSEYTDGTQRAVDKSDAKNTGCPKKMRATCLNCGTSTVAGCVTPWIDVEDGRSVPSDDVSFLCGAGRRGGCEEVSKQKIEILERYPGGESA